MMHDMSELLPKLREIGVGAWDPWPGERRTPTEGAWSGRGWVGETCVTSDQAVVSG
jgi:hypothetical protein